MAYATNERDGIRIYFEDDGGEGAPVVFHGGLLDSVADLRESALAQALPNSEFRLIYVDHRGLGNSGKPHDPEDGSRPRYDRRKPGTSWLTREMHCGQPLESPRVAADPQGTTCG
jgi:pimeloyl-ACP methyl ester carboxylesterase